MKECQAHLEETAKHFADHENLFLKIATRSSTISVSPMEATSVNSSLARLVWNDILLCSVHKKLPIAADSYRRLMARSDFDLVFRETAGCGCWVLLAVMDVTGLEKNLSVTGPLAIMPFNPRQLAEALKYRVPAMQSDKALTQCAVKADVRVTPSQAMLDHLVFSLDGHDLNGTVGISDL
ncbi:MAG: hypothetical protein B7Y53_06980, partial [Halothiobacillus sp. 28-55-5]